MASLYEQLMASKGAPKAAAATNSTQLRKAPVSLRSAMRKYAAGGDVTGTAPDYSRAYDAFGGAGVVNDLRNQFLSMGIDENTIGSILSKYYAPETSQPTPQALTPPEPIPYSPGEGGRGIPTPDPRPEPRYEEPSRPIAPDRETPYIAPQQPQGPRTSYRQEADGTLTEIGYDGQPISGYTEQQTAMDRATRGLDPSEYRYVWNGEGYTKVPNGPQIGYNPEPEMPRPDPQPRYEEPIAPQMPYYPEEPMPETYIEPEVNYDDRMPVLPPVYDDLMPVPPPEVFPQYPTDPGFYERPLDYYNPSPPMDFPTDPGFYQPPVYDNPAIKIAKSLQGGDIGKLLQDLTSRSGGQQSEGLAALIAKALASGGGGGSLDEQRRLIELLGSIRG